MGTSPRTNAAHNNPSYPRTQRLATSSTKTRRILRERVNQLFSSSLFSFSFTFCLLLGLLYFSFVCCCKLLKKQFDNSEALKSARLLFID
jgi:hypothetical protein